MTTPIILKNSIVLTAILKAYYEKKNLVCINNWKTNFVCDCKQEIYFFRKIVSSDSTGFEIKNIFLCSNKLCKKTNQYGIDEIGKFKYIFWYDEENYLFTYIKLPSFNDIENKNKKDSKDEWDRIYNLHTKEKEQIKKQSKELILKSAQKHIEDKKIETSDIEEIFSLSLIEEKLNKDIIELEKGKIIDIDFNIETTRFHIKLCNEYTSIHKDFKFNCCVILPFSKNIKYNYIYSDEYNLNEKKIILKVSVPSLKIGKQ